MQSLRFYSVIVFLCGLIGLSGCSSLTPQASPTQLKLQISATENINPSADGSASPVVVVAYELKSNNRFENSDFFGLYSRATETLSDDMIAQADHNLLPGSTISRQQTLSPQTQYIGIIVAFREIDSASWRLLIPVTPEKLNPVSIKIDKNNAQLVTQE